MPLVPAAVARSIRNVVANKMKWIIIIAVIFIMYIAVIGIDYYFYRKDMNDL